METEKTKDTAGTAGIENMIAQARTAYQHNRVKECLSLTRSVLLAEPDNAAALEMQSSIRADMQRDLSDARALIEESRNKPNAQKFRKAAEIILLKALYLDPDSEGAKTLLASIRTSSEHSFAPAAAPAAVPAAAPDQPLVADSFMAKSPAPSTPRLDFAAADQPLVADSFRAKAPAPSSPRLDFAAPSAAPFSPPSGTTFAPPSGTTFAPPSIAPSSPPSRNSSGSTPNLFLSQTVSQPKVENPNTVSFTTGTSYNKPKKDKRRSRLTAPIVAVAIAVIAVGFILVRQRMSGETSIETTAAASANPDSAPVHSSTTTESAAPQVATAGANVLENNAYASVTTSPATPKSRTNAATGLPPIPDPSATDVAPANRRPGSPNPLVLGSLAVSSPIAAEIYLGDKYLGSTPTTLQLPAGNQTIEYRHGDLKTVVTHVVKANETIPALITFDAVVQLNAKPWANVFLEGSPRLPLGQTPLSNVKLPIGSVLVFENPNFPAKSHKIAADDKAIQIVFP